MSEPTSALTFQDLIVEVARKMGVAYYGADGTEVAQVPDDAHDLDECKRHVNNAIRMFLNDAPVTGWRFSRPVASIVLWPTIDVDADNTVTAGSYDSANTRTPITAEAASFYPSMEGRTITIDGTDHTIVAYSSSTVVYLSGDQSSISAKTWAMTTTGDYTLPATFGGEYNGEPTYAAGTNQGISVEWSNELSIRQWRANLSNDSGVPFWIAIRPMATTFDTRRRWELVVYPNPDEVWTIEFPYTLYFDKLVNLTDVPPTPFLHDDTVKAACLAIVEKDVEGEVGNDWPYYHDRCLANSYRVNGASAPRKLHPSRGGPVNRAAMIRSFRDDIYQRPTVTFNP